MTPSARKITKMLPKGFTLERVGRGKHFIIRSPRGEVLRFEGGMPIQVSSTPKPNSNWENQVRRDLKKVGIEI